MVTEGLLAGPHPFGTTSSFNDFTHGGKSRENYRGDPGESKHSVMFFCIVRKENDKRRL